MSFIINFVGTACPHDPLLLASGGFKGQDVLYNQFCGDMLSPRPLATGFGGFKGQDILKINFVGTCCPHDPLLLAPEVLKDRISLKSILCLILCCGCLTVDRRSGRTVLPVIGAPPRHRPARVSGEGNDALQGFKAHHHVVAVPIPIMSPVDLFLVHFTQQDELPDRDNEERKRNPDGCYGQCARRSHLLVLPTRLV